MLGIYICEDVEGELRYMQKLIEKIVINRKYDEVKILCATRDPLEILRHRTIHRQQSLYFIDIDLKQQMNGIDLAKEIRRIEPRAFIVIVSTHGEMTPLIFKYTLEAMDFIEKDGCNVEERVSVCMENAYQLYRLPDIRDPLKIQLYISGKLTTFLEDEIYSIESIRNKSHGIKIYMQNGFVMVTSELVNIENQIKPPFIRCHKTCIVNVNHIIRLDNNEGLAYLENGRNCRVSRRKTKLIEAYYQRYV